MIGRSWRPVHHALFDGRGDRFRRHLSRVDLLGMMEATAERQTGGDGGESNDGAHGGIPLLGTVTQIGYARLRPSDRVRLRKALMAGPF